MKRFLASIGFLLWATMAHASTCGGTITLGGTAQNIFTTAQLPYVHSYVFANIDATSGSGEPIWISFSGTAAAATVGSYPLAAPTSSTTYVGLNSWMTPFNFGLSTASGGPSIVAATTGHKYSCDFW